MLDRERATHLAGRGAVARAAALVCVAVVAVVAGLAGLAVFGAEVRSWAGATTMPLGAARAPAGPRLPDAPDEAARWLPGYRIDAGGGSTERAPSLDGPSALRISTPAADVELERVAEEEWQLVVHARLDLDAVWFPWRSRATALDASSRATVVLYPAMLGFAARAPAARALGFDWRRYPGELFAPVLLLADAGEAELVAATIWPPRTVVPVFSAGGLALRDDARVPAGTTRRYRALIARRRGDEAQGRAPWLVAALAYRDWLAPNLQREGLEAAAPRWLAESDGWQNVQLQNLASFDAAALVARWRRWRELLPWMQVWGQMSDHAGRARAVAVRLAGDEVGCCLDRTSLHVRYGDGLATAAATIAREGRIGFYARPRSPYGRLDDASSGAIAERAFLLGWLDANRARLGANAFYVDVLGHRWFGEPLAVARFVRDALPPETVVEYAVDVYPRPALVSGSLTGGSFGGGPSREPRELSELAVDRTTFPRFGRAILGERLLFLGESNGDHVLWGEENSHWAERQAFLLGAKLDAMRVAVSYDRPDVPNPALARIVALRRDAGWWRRAPVYLDRLGVAGVPPGVDVRRFRGRDGEDLLVVDNPARRPGVRVRLDGREVALDADPLSIRVVEREA